MITKDNTKYDNRLLLNKKREFLCYLYDENNNVIFARNLYNKTISDRVTQSTIEIPNNYLNDVMIARQHLISETNSIMVDTHNIITKNIYETLFINFINTLQMINKNDLSLTLLNFLHLVFFLYIYLHQNHNIENLLMLLFLKNIKSFLLYHLVFH